MFLNQHFRLLSIIIVSDGNLFNLRLTLKSILHNLSSPYEIIFTNLTEKLKNAISLDLPAENQFLNCGAVSFITERFEFRADAKNRAFEHARGQQLFFVESGFFLNCKAAAKIISLCKNLVSPYTFKIEGTNQKIAYGGLLNFQESFVTIKGKNCSKSDPVWPKSDYHGILLYDALLIEKSLLQKAGGFPAKQNTAENILLTNQLFLLGSPVKVTSGEPALISFKKMLHHAAGFSLPFTINPVLVAEINSYPNPDHSNIRKTELTSIIMPLFNNLDYTKKALLSVINNTTEYYELILVDNASTDGTAEFLAQIAASSLSPFCSQIKVIANQQNLGFAKANNQAVNLATGDLLLFLNNDTEVQPGWLYSLINTLKNNPQSAIAGSRLLYPDTSLQHAGVAFENMSVQHLFQHFASDFPPALSEKSLQAVTAACMIIKKEIFIDLGGFDEAFINCFEDTDLCLKAKKAGYEIIYQPDSVVIHHESKSKGRKDHETAAGALLGSRWNKFIKSDATTLLQSAGLAYRKDPAGEILDYNNSPEGVSGIFQKGMSDFIKKDYNRAWPQLKQVAEMLPAEAPSELYSALNTIFQSVNLARDYAQIEVKPLNFYQNGLTSIIIPVFNNLEYTRTALKAIIENTHSPYELIIINNNSTDGTFEFLEQLKKQPLPPAACLKISVIHNQRNHSFAIANNQAAKIASGEYLLCLNNDTKVTEFWLEALINRLKRIPKCAAAGAKLIYEDKTIQHAGVVSDIDFDIPYHFMQHAAEFHPAATKPRPFYAVTAACILINHSAFDLAGGFNEEFINCYEDIDLCYKVGDLGLEIYYEPAAVVYHYESKTPGRKDNVSFSAGILRKLWHGRMPENAKKCYGEFGLKCRIDHQLRTIIVDFTDISMQERINQANQLFVKGEFSAVCKLLWPLYQFTPEKQAEIVYQLLALSLEYSCNREQALEVANRLYKYFPTGDNLQLLKLFTPQILSVKPAE